tara:strand:+ start:275 stop:418 length:144 start_codon:yes stop_codon:yes gene_type:complete
LLTALALSENPNFLPVLILFFMVDTLATIDYVLNLAAALFFFSKKKW